MDAFGMADEEPESRPDESKQEQYLFRGLPLIVIPEPSQFEIPSHGRASNTPPADVFSYSWLNLGWVHSR